MTLSRSNPATGWLKLLLIMFALLGAAVSASAQDMPPRPDGPVYDGADILSAATEAELDQRLRLYNQQTGHAIIVATVPSLGGEPIEPYATELFSTWGIGGERRDTGLLLLVARDDRKMRIEVGYGLHPYFGGVMAGRVIRDTITPRFKQGDFDAGVTEGVDAILSHLAKSPEDAIAIEEAAQAAEANRSRNDGGFPIGTLIWLGFMFFFFVLPIIRGSRRSRRYRTKGKGPWGERASDAADVASNIILWEVGSAIARGAMRGGGSSWGGGGGGGFSGGGGFGGFGGGMSGGGGASGGW
ncbi:TPM domain-containing protein [uncultured Erythrobacter sp.]|uniref:TPM domain-containing protein n=1 Tax=uncultured Erythrobacter sp. TaxID=263913 RepID=UPI00263911C6|nr:TPM domain-containing protein [uncultured Erythrobacter sp.]